jgi:hypothetical protein
VDLTDPQPRCAGCHPCRPEDIDLTTTVWRCPEHEQAHIEFMTRVGFAMIPIPAYVADAQLPQHQPPRLRSAP